MDRLQKLSGNGSYEDYPISNETLEVLDGHCEYINAVLDGLDVSAGTVVFLNYNGETGAFGSSKSILNAMAYIRGNSDYIQSIDTYIHPKGALYKIENISGITVAELLSGTAERSIEFIDNPVNVSSDPNNDGSTDYVEWTGVINRRRARIVEVSPPYAVNPFKKYTFTTLKRVLEIDTETYTLMTGNAEPITNGTASAVTFSLFDCLFRRTGKRVELQLALTVNSGITPGGTFYIPVNAAAHSGMNLINERQYPLLADNSAFNSTHLGAWLVSNGQETRLYVQLGGDFEATISGTILLA
jgi:hypothetical protein